MSMSFPVTMYPGSAASQQDAIFRDFTAGAAGVDLYIVASDVDGTLSPITDDAQHTRLDPAAVTALRALASHSHVSVVLITGRPADYIRQLLDDAGLGDLPISILGVYGRDSRIVLADGSVQKWTHPLVEQANASVAEFHEIFTASLGRLSPSTPEFSTDTRRAGEADAPVIYEPKPGMMTYHYGMGGGREDAFALAMAAPEVQEAMRRLGLHVAAAVSGAIEIDGLPEGTMDKGRALTGFVKQRAHELAHRAGRAPRIRLSWSGDDTADGPARKATRILAKKGHVEQSVAATVYSAPDAKRAGTPAHLLDRFTDLIFRSPSEHGNWLGKVASVIARGPTVPATMPGRPLGHRPTQPRGVSRVSARA